MQSLTFSGVALAALMTTQPALAAIDSTAGAPPVPAAAAIAPPMAMPKMHQVDAIPPMPAPPPRPIMTTHATPAPSAYVRPAYGYQLPQYWMAPNFYMADYRSYGLPRPAAGFGWSRYYDDAVLTDQWGRVYDARSNYGWDHRGHGRNSHDRDAAVGGVAGAAVGAVAGNLIAGAGSRLAGSLIGGGVGALAGLAIEAATSKHRREHRGYDERRGGYDDGYYRDGDRGAHWGGGYGGYGNGYAACSCGDETVTTTVTRTSWGGGQARMIPRQVVYYENVYAAAAAPTKMKERRTTKIRPRVRGDY